MNVKRTEPTMRWLLLLACGGVLQFFSAVAYTSASTEECYSLVPQKRDDGSLIEPAPICVSLTQNLNHFCDSAPHVCGVPLSPEIKELSAPQWKTLDPVQSFPLLEKLVRGMWEPNRQTNAKSMQRVIDETLSTYRSALNEKRLKISESRFDIANGYGPEPVYRIDTGRCEMELAQWRRHPQLRSYREVTGFARTPEQEKLRATFLAQWDPALYPQRAAEVADGARPLIQLRGGGATFQGRLFTGSGGTAIFHDAQTFYVSWEVSVDRLSVLKPRPTGLSGWARTLCEIQYHFRPPTPTP